MAYENKLTPQQDESYIDLKVAAATTIEPATMVMINSSGYAVPAADTSGGRFVGFSRIGSDNSTGSDGDTVVNVRAHGVIEIDIAGVAQADVGKTVYVNTATSGQLSGQSNNVVIGQLVNVIASNRGAVRFRPVQLDGASTPTAIAVLTSATLTDNSGGTPDVGDLVAAIDSLTAVQMTLAGYTFYQNIVAAGTTNAMDQVDISGGGATFSGANLVQPDVPRNIVVTVTDADTSVTAGTVTVTGVGVNGEVVTEELTGFPGGLVQTGSVIFAKVTSIEGTLFAGNGAGDAVDAGWGTKIGLPCAGNGFGVVKLVSNGTEEAASAVDATNCSVIPTTAPDGTNDYEIWYEYTLSGLSATNDTITEIKNGVAKLIAEHNAARVDIDNTRTTLTSLINNLTAAGVIG